MIAMKLQKLVYYAQAWAVVWDDEPLFDERIEAWSNGPVVRDLYDAHRGEYKVDAWPKGSAEKLTSTQRETIDAVLAYYGGMSSLELSDRTHGEAPWQEARQGMPPMERGNAEITTASMLEHYSSLPVA